MLQLLIVSTLVVCSFDVLCLQMSVNVVVSHICPYMIIRFLNWSKIVNNLLMNDRAEVSGQIYASMCCGEILIGVTCHCIIVIAFVSDHFGILSVSQVCCVQHILSD